MKNGNSFLTLIVIGASLFILLLGFFHPVTALTQDLGRHLLTGQQIVTTRQIPTTNQFSYTYPTFSYINTHWLSQVTFYLIKQLVGFPGLFIMMLLLIAAAFALQLDAARKHASSLALGIGSVLALGILLERTDLRPELFSFLFLSLTLYLLFWYDRKRTKLLYMLIPLQLLWINMHIYFALGLVTQALFLFEAVIIHRKNFSIQRVREPASIFVLSCLVSLLNPHGIAGLLYPLRVSANYGYSIEENQTVFFLQQLGFFKPSFPYLYLYVFTLFTSLTVTFKKTKLRDWLLSVVFTYLAFSAVRNLPLLVFATFVPLTTALSRLFELLAPYLGPTGLTSYRQLLIVVLLCSLFFFPLRQILSSGPLGYSMAPGAGKAVDFLTKEHIRGPILNNFDIGGYLIYRLYPRERVFVDGRPEAYPASFFSDVYKPLQENPKVFQQVVNQYGIRTIFFSHTDQTPWATTFLTWVVNQPEWKIVYLDDYAIILVKQTTTNALIKKFGMTRDTLRVTKAEQTFEANLRLASFFSKVGWNTEGLPYFLALLEEKPTFCPALGAVIQIYQAQNNPAAAVYYQRYTASCL